MSREEVQAFLDGQSWASGVPRADLSTASGKVEAYVVAV